MPMIDLLTDRDLLRRCLRGATQNANESINSIIWSILPKSKYHGYRSIRGAAAIATIFFNHGRSELVNVFRELDISITDDLLEALLDKDQKRLEKAMADTNDRESIKKEKQQRRSTIDASEDEMDYAPGMF